MKRHEIQFGFALCFGLVLTLLYACFTHGFRPGGTETLVCGYLHAVPHVLAEEGRSLFPSGGKWLYWLLVFGQWCAAGLAVALLSRHHRMHNIMVYNMMHKHQAPRSGRFGRQGGRA